MKRRNYSRIRKSLLFSLISFGLFILSPIHSNASSSCSPMSNNSKRSISKKFGQSPFNLLSFFLKIQKKTQLQESITEKNNLLASSFDISKIYRTNIKLFNSKALSPIVFDWIRTQYFAFSKKDISQKIDSLININRDLLSDREIKSLKQGSYYTKNFKKRNCTFEESKFIGCSKIYEVTIQNSPEVSCKKKEMISSFETTFFLTFSKRYGFKIIDIAISGKRVVIDTIKHMSYLKSKGFNNNALYSHLSTLAQNAKSFKLPKKQISTKQFLAKLRRSKNSRIPASL